MLIFKAKVFLLGLKDYLDVLKNTWVYVLGKLEILQYICYLDLISDC